ncbi:MAG: phosphatidylserine decarboxylase [bacterium]
MIVHQYVERRSACAVSETFFGDPVVSFLYSRVREDSGWLYRALTSSRLTNLLGMLQFDVRPRDPALMRRRLASACGVDFSECADPLETLDTARKVFERKIRYWECRPMDPDPAAIVSPSDARLLVGSFHKVSGLLLKEKFFRYEEMLGNDKLGWHDSFRGGDYAVLRLTPDKYHRNHAPVTGVVRDIYEVEGVFQSCHPAVVIAQAAPYSKNRRTVTIIDTDVPGGTQAGLVAMVEVVALMIGEIVQYYCEERYDAPLAVQEGLRLSRGCPKSLFRPGSSTVVLLFQSGRIRFSEDLVVNLRRTDVRSCYSDKEGGAVVETDVAVRSTIARVVPGGRA